MENIVRYVGEQVDRKYEQVMEFAIVPKEPAFDLKLTPGARHQFTILSLCGVSPNHKLFGVQIPMLAALQGISERQTQRNIAELRQAGYISTQSDGRSLVIWMTL